MSLASQTTLQLPALGKKSMTRLIAEAKRNGVSPEDYAKRLVEGALTWRRDAEEMTFAEILGPARRGAEKVTDPEIVEIVKRVRAKRRARNHRGKKN